MQCRQLRARLRQGVRPHRRRACSRVAVPFDQLGQALSDDELAHQEASRAP